MIDLSQRINRIVGQLHGIEKMAAKKRDCGEILQQIAAVKKAIDSLSKEIVISDICRFVPRTKMDKVQQMVERVINL
ncbi:metal-sensitive transcriptional regulator [Patescibacteria group bacterium]|nr:metal-sensitive transcriptional regulator [Patescibacteria group bacterium]MCL5091538.1 metal-sensitive transcriptional regulator [Patescibacteria group bacterium]